jgi:hypothetical protein
MPGLLPVVLDTGLRLLLATGGLLLVLFTIMTAIRVFVLPRGENAWLARLIFRTVYSLFLLRAYKVDTYRERDAILALFAPVVLLVQPLIYLTLIVIGYMPIYQALDPRPLTLYTLEEAFHLSGSSLMTLGFAAVGEHALPEMMLSFSQAALGMMLVALLIAYLPAIYTAFSQREKQVAMLEVRAGSPPSGVELLTRIYSNRGDIHALKTVWTRWEEWFAEIEESHTSLVALVFFRSPMPDRHWITAAGAVLDAAALLDSTVDEARQVESVLCIRAGYVSLRRIADFFGNIPYDPDPAPDDPISIAREEFDEACDELAAAGIPLRDRDEAWRHFQGWRVNYDRVLVGLARLTSAPYAPWSSDRTLSDMRDVPGMTPFEAFEYQPRYERDASAGDGG